MDNEFRFITTLTIEDALCISKVGWSTENEQKLFLEAQKIIAKRADYLKLKWEEAIIGDKLKKI